MWICCKKAIGRLRAHAVCMCLFTMVVCFRHLPIGVSSVRVHRCFAPEISVSMGCCCSKPITDDENGEKLTFIDMIESSMCCGTWYMNIKIRIKFFEFSLL